MKDFKIEVYDITNQKYLGKISYSVVNDKYDEWRSKGYGVLTDRDKSICLDKEDPEDDGLYYNEQIEN